MSSGSSKPAAGSNGTLASSFTPMQVDTSSSNLPTGRGVKRQAAPASFSSHAPTSRTQPDRNYHGGEGRRHSSTVKLNASDSAESAKNEPSLTQKKQKVNHAASSSSGAPDADQNDVDEKNPDQLEPDDGENRILSHMQQLFQYLTKSDTPSSFNPYQEVGMLEFIIENLGRKAHTVGILGDTGTGKSFLINMLLFLTARSSAEYGSSKFRPDVVPGKEYEALEIHELLKERTQENQRRKQQIIPPSNTKVQSLSQDITASMCQSLGAAISQHMKQFQDTIQSVVNSPPGHLTQFERGSYWLVPDAINTSSTTQVVARLHYGRTFHACVQFKSIEQLQESAFQSLEKRRSGEELTDSEQDELCGITGWNSADVLNDDQLPKYANITQLEQIPVRAELRQHADQQIILYGIGSRSTFRSSDKSLNDLMVTFPTAELDRIWLREQLSELLQPSLQFAVSLVDIFAPCSVLTNITLLDIPGSNDSSKDEIIKEALGECDMLLVLGSKNLKASKDVARLLAAGYLQNVLRLSEETPKEVHFVFGPEKEYGHTSLHPNSAKSSERASQLEMLKEANMKWIDDQIAKSAPAIQATMKKNVRDRLQVYAIEPVAFASLMLNRHHASPSSSSSSSSSAVRSFAPSSGELRSMVHSSGLLRLLASIRSLGHRSCCTALRGLGVSDGVYGDGTILSSLHKKVTAALTAARPASIEAPAFFQDEATRHLIRNLGATIIPRARTLFLKNEINSAFSLMDTEFNKNTFRAEWTKIFKDILSKEIKAAMFQEFVNEGTKHASSSFEKIQKNLKSNNLITCLHPKTNGTPEPLRLSNGLFGWFQANPFDANKFIENIRKETIKQISERVIGAYKVLLQRLTRTITHKEDHNKIAAEIDGCLARTLPAISLILGELFESSRRTGLPTSTLIIPGNLNTIRFHLQSCIPTLKEYLQENFANWRKVADEGKSVRAIQSSISKSIPNIIQRCVVQFEFNLNAAFDHRCKQVYKKIMSPWGSPTYLFRTTAYGFFRDLRAKLDESDDDTDDEDDEEKLNDSDGDAAMRDDTAASSQARSGFADFSLTEEQLRAVQHWLKQWNELALMLLQSEDTAVVQGMNAFEHDLYQSITQRHYLAEALSRRLKRNVPDCRLKLSRLNDPCNMVFGATLFGFKALDIKDRLARKNQVATDLLDQTLMNRNGLTGTEHEPPRGMDFTTIEDRFPSSQPRRIAHVPSDGNCLFTSLAHQLMWGTTLNREQSPVNKEEILFRSGDVREFVVDRIRSGWNNNDQNRAKFRELYQIGIEEYCSRIQENGAYGGELEIWAFVQEFNVQVAVWMSESNRPILYTVDQSPQSSYSRCPTIHIAYVNALGSGEKNHYVSLVPHPRAPRQIPAGRKRFQMNQAARKIQAEATKKNTK